MICLFLLGDANVKKNMLMKIFFHFYFYIIFYTDYQICNIKKTKTALQMTVRPYYDVFKIITPFFTSFCFLCFR